MKTAVEIYRFLPKTNCGTCGLPSCFGFAAKLATNQASPNDCPLLPEETRKALGRTGRNRPESPGTVYEQTLAILKPKIGALDFGKIAPLFGARLNSDVLELEFLSQTYRVTHERILDSSGMEPQPWISILICNHLCMPDPPAPSGEWITFGSVPASHAKDKAWAGHVENVIADHFSGKREALKTACAKLGGTPVLMQGSHDAAFSFRFFPHYPALLLFHDATAEENFPALCKLLLDKTAPRYLDIESMVVMGEEFARQLTE